MPSAAGSRVAVDRLCFADTMENGGVLSFQRRGGGTSYRPFLREAVPCGRFKRRDLLSMQPCPPLREFFCLLHALSVDSRSGPGWCRLRLCLQQAKTFQLPFVQVCLPWGVSSRSLAGGGLQRVSGCRLTRQASGDALSETVDEFLGRELFCV